MEFRTKSATRPRARDRSAARELKLSRAEVHGVIIHYPFPHEPAAVVPKQSKDGHEQGRAV